MAKNPNKKATQWNEPMTDSMKVFLAGCVAELYLLIVRRFYVNGSAYQMIAWHDIYFKVFAAIGAALLVAGVALFLRKQPKTRKLSYYLGGFGAFLLLVNLLVMKNESLLKLFTMVVPLVMLAVLLWGLYDRECALSLTMLGGTLVALWGARRMAYTQYASIMTALIVIYLILVIAVAVLVKTNKLGKLLPAKANRLPIYVCAVLSVLGLAATFLGTTIAYYTMWVLAFVTFALVVYYTVKQL